MYKLITVLVVSFFVFILWIIYLANAGQSNPLFDLVKIIPYGDKIGHFCLFGLLTIGLNIVFRFKTLTIYSVNIYKETLLIIAYVFAEEFSQGFIPYRTFDAIDLMADAVGICVFSVLSYRVNNNLKDKLWIHP